MLIWDYKVSNCETCKNVRCYRNWNSENEEYLTTIIIMSPPQRPDPYYAFSLDLLTKKTYLFCIHIWSSESDYLIKEFPRLLNINPQNFARKLKTILTYL
jgi:hypothetical protein